MTMVGPAGKRYWLRYETKYWECLDGRTLRLVFVINGRRYEINRRVNVDILASRSRLESFGRVLARMEISLWFEVCKQEGPWRGSVAISDTALWFHLTGELVHKCFTRWR
ncbi:hypothetical protein vBPaeMV524_gp82 [Pseudomonas phage vB_PaeM_V524]|uniref:Uncharacterized protein n=1 Tax=Pseudomonas phage jett TaxID=2719605 RepID=A0A6G9LPE5_9CAUD|nr:hypothetical protein jett_82 [Pseudomonas phage jett]QSM01462.1 hypothetical protein vBPaeMV524_gp82 [Pseudomonas phage vB_PaeM_V524]